MLTPARETKKKTTDAGTDEERPDLKSRVFFRYQSMLTKPPLLPSSRHALALR
jgi:hypothetical protein